jgi:ketosteroid isomerase-like protein
MSRENIEVVRSAFAAVNRGDRETAIGFLHPEVVIDATRSVFNPTSYVGMQGIRQWMVDTDEVWRHFGLEVSELIDAGDKVVVIGRLVGRGKASGVKVEQPIAGIWTVQDGRILRGEIGYTDRGEALEAAGLKE